MVSMNQFGEDRRPYIKSRVKSKNSLKPMILAIIFVSCNTFLGMAFIILYNAVGMMTINT